VLWSDAVEAGGHDRSFFFMQAGRTGYGLQGNFIVQNLI
jgi:hypothetical protein